MNIDVSFLDELKKLSLIVNKRVTSKYSGEHKSHYTGSGTLFKDHRPYALGDNYKAIDWKVFARTDDLYIKQYEEERNLNVHILIDSSASMGFKKKFEMASKLALGFGFLAMKNNERVQFATFSKDLQIIKASKGSKQILSILDHVNKINPSKESNFYDSIVRYKKLIHNKSFIVIISDFMFDTKEILDSLFLRGRSHTIKLIQVLDDEEKNMPLEGDFKLIDMESNFELKTYISRRSQQDYLKKMKEHVKLINDACNNFSKVKFYQHTTSENIFDIFLNLMG